MQHNQIKDIRVLVWDFDGTLYRPTAALNEAIMHADYELVMRHTGWTLEKTKEEFSKIFQIKTPSSTETAAILAGITIEEAAIECENYKDRLDFLRPDAKLADLFAKLHGFTHYMLVNGIQEKVRTSLERLGVSTEIFVEIVTAEVVGVTKPNPKGFEYILKKTGLPSSAHLMIGDREAVDIAPAKALGMKTCLVWSETPSLVADVTLPSVYDVARLLT